MNRNGSLAALDKLLVLHIPLMDPFPFGQLRQEVTRARTPSHTLRVHQHMHIHKSLEHQHGLSVCPAPLAGKLKDNLR